MAQDKAQSFDAETITKLMVKAKSTGGELNFAFGLAAKPADCGLLLDRRKPGGVLKKTLKGLPGIKKVCFGTLSLDGNAVLLKAEKPLKGIIKQLRRRFRDEGLNKFKPTLVGPDGVEIDEDSLPDAELYDDSETDGAAPAEATSTEAEAPGSPDPAALKARLVKLAQASKALGDAAPAGIGTQIAAAAKLLSAGDLEAVAKAADEIKAQLSAAAPGTEAPAPATTEQLGKLKKALVALLARVKALPATPTQAALLAEVKRIGALLQGNDAAAAQEALRALARDVDAAADPSEATTDPQLIWREARESVDAGISQLQAKLKGYSDPVMDRIAEYGLNGLTEGHQTALQKALFEFNSAAGAEKAKAAAALAEQAQSYKNFVSGNRIMALCEKNPFGVALPIRKELGAALDRISQLAKSAA